MDDEAGVEVPMDSGRFAGAAGEEVGETGKEVAGTQALSVSMQKTHSEKIERFLFMIDLIILNYGSGVVAV